MQQLVQTYQATRLCHLHDAAVTVVLFDGDFSQTVCPDVGQTGSLSADIPGGHHQFPVREVQLELVHGPSRTTIQFLELVGQ